MIKKIFLPAAAVLVLLNIGLLFWDDEGRIGRTNFIQDWEQVMAQDVEETLSAPAVLTSADEIPVYLQPASGSLSEMLVEKGDAVEEGDDLFTYHVRDYTTTHQELSASITTLEEQTAAVEQAMNQIDEIDVAAGALPTDIAIPETFENADVVNEESAGTEAISEALQQASEEQTAQIQEHYRISLEKELAEKQAALAAAEEQLSALEDTGEYITVTSPAAGTIKDIAVPGEAPVITINSSDLVISGELEEAERKQVQSGMTVKAAVADDGIVLEGEITELADQPASIKDKTSFYTFEATYQSEEEQAEKLVAGYHLKTDILLAYASQAPAVKPDQIKDGKVWTMANGQAFTTNVKVGATNDKQAAITSGMEPGTTIPARAGDYYDNEPFVTPWKPQQISWSDFRESFTSYEFLLGLLDY
ncbi:efflux RND transporter periplasmic adaptor subunit [Terribacillus sp. DMT04]|uniref:HlyD family efflux transporter periplasmic adaptor subunit n=1 Tax=Terribacillus sp. DMT04 TaxID=2850441 RepID=UPI001C2B8E05|nr:efflux RND transporter periplasmic adaptor subunit [Terribacillus sp. DMT04]QXE01125.1 efflux RND transporter periplasmic adaptor subunit [Terribacillus sp. DMT04]